MPRSVKAAIQLDLLRGTSRSTHHRGTIGRNRTVIATKRAVVPNTEPDGQEVTSEGQSVPVELCGIHEATALESDPS
ncbi:MAG TPA: hypothetical protein VL329_03510 [Nitrospiraceae bacterium]|nr:hypothetical protein [Nitrospiraceae bacterium]